MTTTKQTIETMTGKEVSVTTHFGTDRSRDGTIASYIDDHGNKVAYVGDDEARALTGLLAYAQMAQVQ